MNPQESFNIVPLIQPNFDQFWQSYPRRVAKADARKAWDKAVKLASPESIIAAVEEQKKHCEQWQKDNGQFIPYPASWLRGERWEDECEPMIQAIAQSLKPHGSVTRLKAQRFEEIKTRIKAIKDGVTGLNSHTQEEIAELKKLRAEKEKLSAELGLA